MSAWDREVDFIAAGTGLGGLSAAITAHDGGLKVLIVDKAPKLGGVCAYSGGEVFVPCNHLMEQEGRPDDPAQANAYLDFLAGGYADETLAGKLREVGPQATRWFEEHAGVRWKIIKDFPDYHHPHAPGTAAHGRYLEPQVFDGKSLGDWQRKCYQSPHMPPGITHDELFAFGGLTGIRNWDYTVMGQRMMTDQRTFGPGMMGWFLKAALVDRGIECHLNAPVERVIIEDGRAVGAVIQIDGVETRVRAKRGVMLAIGGYDWDEDRAKFHEGLPEWKSTVQPSVSGDNVILGGEVGASIAAVPSYNTGMFFGYSVPGEQHDGAQMWRASWEGGYPHAIWVNAAGNRFCDEAFYRQYLPRVREWDGVTQSLPNYPPYLIFDQNFRDRYSLGTFMPGQAIPEALAAQADTPRELAEKLGIDADGLEATLARFNHNAADGVDPDFERGRFPWAAMMTGDPEYPNPNLAPVVKAPFYGVRLTPVGVGINSAGLQTDEFARVVHVRGHAIEGLYAAGNSAALLDIGAGYQSGLSNLRGMTWGWVAGRHAAA
ncbi:MAG: 3-oxosteroid 1-dehydrogenase [Myxococcota bacterium]|jgi:3-oxosteroid 1-dehydrogenase